MSAAYEPVKVIDDREDVQLDPYTRSRRYRGTRLAAIATAATCLFGFALYQFTPLWSGSAEVLCYGRTGIDHLSDNTTHAAPVCASIEPLTVSTKPNVWRNLDVAETVEVREWVSRSELGLNLTKTHLATISDNSIFLVEAFRPAKGDVLRYLDEDGPAPERYARVTIHHGAFAEPVIRDYLVGPLPVSSVTKITQLTEIYHEPEISYNARGWVSLDDLRTFLKNVMAPLSEVTEELFGGSVHGHANDTLVANGGYAPFSFDGSFRRAWISWRRNGPGAWLHPVGFFQYVTLDGTDPSQWKVLKVVYNHQIFKSNEEFLEAYHNGTLRKVPYPPDSDLWWSSRRRRGPQRDLDDRAGPRSVSFNGLRIRVDKPNQYISWMGWSMSFGFDRDMGLGLYNINFLGERIVYELAPQDALAQYAGNDPMQTTTAWLDRYFGMGLSVRDLLPGYDCPIGAVYFPATLHVGLGSVSTSRAICVFEMDTGKPVTRHFGYLNSEFGAVKGYALTVRSISTVGNYDYLFDYNFHLDGTIEVRLSASGYLQAGYWEEQHVGYGARIQERTMGALHDHVINYKVDLDIAGTANSLLETTTSVEEITVDWADEDWGDTVLQQRINRRYIETEDEALLKYPKNFQGGYAIVNKNSTNAWGNVRGYAIHAGDSPVHNTVVGSKRLLENANWARYNLAVSQRKDSEPSSSSMWNINLPGKPTVNFHRFFDSESLNQEDLVAWINVGTHHLPQAEDVPNTKTVTATSSFLLTPLNYFDYDVSIDSTNAVLVKLPDGYGGTLAFEEYGVKSEFCTPPQVDDLTYDGPILYGPDGKRTDPTVAQRLKNALPDEFHAMHFDL